MAESPGLEVLSKGIGQPIGLVPNLLLAVVVEPGKASLLLVFARIIRRFDEAPFPVQLAVVHPASAAAEHGNQNLIAEQLGLPLFPVENAPIGIDGLLSCHRQTPSKG